MKSSTIYFLVSFSSLVLTLTALIFLLDYFIQADRPIFLFVIAFILCMSISSYLTCNRFGFGLSDPVFIITSFISIYTIAPTFQSLIGFEIYLINSIYSYSNYEIAYHCLRFIVFCLIINFCYFILCDFGKTKNIFDLNRYREKKIKSNNGLILVISIILLISVIALLTILAAPVNDYYGNYTKYDHLPAHLRYLVSILKRFYWGLIPITVTCVIITFKDSLPKISICIMILCGFDLYISSGSRINTFIILTQFLIIYNLYVNKINLRRGIIYAVPLVFGFSLVEYIRLNTGAMSLQEISLVPGEFNALFFPSIDLFKMRELNSMPSYDDLMIVKDVLFILPFFDYNIVDPMRWYWLNFHSASPVAPFTMGPIADSAFFGGWYSIIARAVFFAINLFLLKAFFLRFKDTWYGLLIFTYCVSISILALKYSFLSYQEQVLKNILPSLFLILPVCYFVKRLRI